MAIASFANSIGAALTISVGQNVLVNGLRLYIPRYTTGVDTEAVVAAGAGDIRDLVPPGELQGLRQAYARSLDHTFAFAVAAAGLAVGFALLVSSISFGARERILWQREGFGLMMMMGWCRSREGEIPREFEAAVPEPTMRAGEREGEDRVAKCRGRKGGLMEGE